MSNEMKGLVSEIENWLGICERCSDYGTADRLLQRALTSLKEVSQWQPIETAPRNGDEILMHIPGYGIERLFFRKGKVPKIGQWDRPSKWERTDGTFGFKEDSPDGWMPLPSPPSTNELKESHEH